MEQRTTYDRYLGWETESDELVTYHDAKFIANFL